MVAAVKDIYTPHQDGLQRHDTKVSHLPFRSGVSLTPLVTDDYLRAAAQARGNDLPVSSKVEHETVKQLADALLSPDPKIKEAAEEKLLQLLKAGDPKQKAAVVQLLCGAFSNPGLQNGEGLPLFYACAFFIKEHKLDNLLSKDQRSELISTLRALSHQGVIDGNLCAAEAYMALASLGDKQARKEMLAYLRKEHRDDQFACSLIEGLAHFNDREVTQLLVKLLHKERQGGAAMLSLLSMNVNWTEHSSELSGLLIGAITPGASGTFSAYARRIIEQGLTGPNSEQFRRAFHEAAKKLPNSQREQLEHGLVAFDEARKLGISPTLRVGFDVLAELVKNRLDNKPDGRPLAVIEMSANDQTGALYALDQTIRDLIKAGYKVVVHTVKTDKELIDSLKDATNEQPAQVIVIAGHGKPTSVALGADDPAKTNQDTTGAQYLDIQDEDPLLAAGIGSCLASGGQILLASCSAGQGGLDGTNVAAMLSHVFPQAAAGGIFYAQVPVKLQGGLTMDGQLILDIGFVNDSGEPAMSKAVAYDHTRAGATSAPRGRILSEQKTL